MLLSDADVVTVKLAMGTLAFAAVAFVRASGRDAVQLVDLLRRRLLEMEREP